ncbi:hypothetical protein [Chitinasiproducens palmae]|uniref:Cyclase dehydrase n=1 Tax=Chitinasiproducens palmae TaxID=1770053 RepID=A0A1H2PK35_9BURK|nr:hypothetical protein [Chitinasiproducens palmae]SDV46759.1 hypothetical protein SAMN05216551_101612 [Chitinasiproducens palmae]
MASTLQKASSAAPTVARGLGWFSIALGVTELLVPRAVAAFAGSTASPGRVRLYGLREIACGIGLLRANNPRGFVWARLAGDAVDLATVGADAGASAQARQRAAVAAVGLAGVATLDLGTAAALEYEQRRGRRRSAGGAVSANAARRYVSRSGFPRVAEAMRGEASRDFTVPRDMATPDALRAYGRPPRSTERFPNAQR